MNAASVPGQALRESDRAALRELLEESVKFDEPMAPKTSMRVGGTAAAFATLDETARLVALLKYCNRERIAWTVLGLGSNVVVRDEGFAGVIVRLAGGFARVDVQGTIVRAGGAAPIAALCREAAKAGLEGAEALVGIPGTVGGAVRMNAGTKVEIGDLVRSIELLVAGEDVQSMTLPAFRYRSSDLDRSAVVCSAELELRIGEKDAVQARLREHIERRNATQPLALPNSGSVFRNPEGDFAARLIEASGCKGMRVGRVEVSTKHANFIVNHGGGSCADVVTLMTRVRDMVKRKTGVELEPEIQIL
ncbi:MAG TPA: UDP-N-acetylmuramate dehydrogenase [Candidatus Acidoferrales bacterium]|nr:UDP-N-acetylmuramate dehydrogenase [Candidatus Acidoferrales bacterium]